MRFKVDENLPLAVAQRLRDAGHDAITVVEQHMAGTKDAALAGVCRNEQRCLVTPASDGNTGGSCGGECWRCAETPTGRPRQAVRGRIGALQRTKVRDSGRERACWLELGRMSGYNDPLESRISEMSV